MNAKTYEKPPFFQEIATPLAFEPASARYYLLRLHAPLIAANGRPGQFVMLSCHSDEAGQCDPLLPRPLALLDVDASLDTVDLLFFVHGKGTALLRRIGEALRDQGSSRERLRLIGPLGNGFQPIPDVAVHLGVGGGSGVAPLVFFFRELNRTSPYAERHLILAARSQDQLIQEKMILIPGTKFHPATDDGSAGFHGHGIQALEALLKGFAGCKVGIYLAGPERMMEAGAKSASALGLPVRVSLEARMACGVGVCRACIVDGHSPHPKSGLKRRVICQDGPVFNPQDLVGWA